MKAKMSGRFKCVLDHVDVGSRSHLGHKKEARNGVVIEMQGRRGNCPVVL
jgi:hypothetical protein